MSKVQQEAEAALGMERWRFFAQLWRALGASARLAARASIQGSVEARVAACRAVGGCTASKKQRQVDLLRIRW
jgi:hypothetical protein